MIQQQKEHGFAAIEAVLIVVIVAGIVGAGAWVYSQRKTNKTPASSAVTTPAATPAAATIDPSKVGTTTGIDQVLTAESQSESQADDKGSATVTGTTGSTNSSASNIGDSYDESSF